MSKKIGFVLVLLMALLQGAYALLAYIDPTAFAGIRGTALVSSADADWVQIYASRTLFIALLIGYLLYLRQYKILVVAALLGCVMPFTDGWLAYEAGASAKVVYKHLATAVYLISTAVILHFMVCRRNQLAQT